VKISKQSAIFLSVSFVLASILSACSSPNHSNPDNSVSIPTQSQSLSQALRAETARLDNPSTQPTQESTNPSVEAGPTSSPDWPQASQFSASPTLPQATEPPSQAPTATLESNAPQASAGEANSSQPAPKAAGVSEKPAVGFAAPEFSLTTLDGKTISLSDLHGKDVVINYWVTWCIPCKEELPVLDKLGQEYAAQGVTLLSIDGIQQDTLGDVQSIVSKLALTHPVLLDEGNSFSKAYWVKFMPTSIFIDKQGIIRFIQLGSTSEDDFRAKIEDLLSRQS
jgi:cytochrome c biogenesis protein CcmG, thiol:disulfide interchange protein DsbE